MIDPSVLPSQPGVYRFLDHNNKILYVGKARDLKKRVLQYFQKNLSDRKTIALMKQAVTVDVTITENENQALLLECNLIKAHHPKYNILLRDDKSYPYLFLSTPHNFPRLDYFRGNPKQSSGGRYFGPYPNAGSVRENLALIQKLFKLRQCRDVFFKNRTRPCLQYQINRCTAPCVQYISKENYQAQVRDAILFLEGKNHAVMQSVQAKMEKASQHQEYETAAHWRDVFIRLRKLQSQQFITGGKGNVDVFGIVEKMGKIAITIVMIRHGQLLGHKTFFPNTPLESSVSEVLSAFIPQHYFHSARETEKIDRIVLSQAITDRLWIQNALREHFHAKIIVSDRKTAAYREWESIALSNATSELMKHTVEKDSALLKLEYLQTALNLPNFPERIECFDISHTMGEATKASCVVFGAVGFIRKAYRQFNIDNITPGDDYAAMRQALTRRYTQLKMDDAILPDLIMIDGGIGQLRVAAAVLETLQMSGVFLLGVAKGVTRKAGVERLFLWGRDAEIILPVTHPARHLIQLIRDEAHRFAITAHRKARGKNQLRSTLDLIAGIGKKRKIDLLKYFGGLQELQKASVAEIAKVPGIGMRLAQKLKEM